MIPSMTPFEIAQLFPNSASTIKKKIAEQEELLEAREKERRRLAGLAIGRYSKPRLTKWLDVFLFLDFPNYLHTTDGRVVWLQKNIERNKKILYHIELNKTPRSQRKRDFEQKLARARAVPIDTILDFNNQGFARCVFHNEKTPSMKYYAKDNRVKCFGGCGRYADGIEIVRHLYNYSFVEAVNYLSSL